MARLLWVVVVGVLMLLSAGGARASDLEWTSAGSSKIEVVPGTVVGASGGDLVVVHGGRAQVVEPGGVIREAGALGGKVIPIGGGGGVLVEEAAGGWSVATWDGKTGSLSRRSVEAAPEGGEVAVKGGDDVYVAGEGGLWRLGGTAWEKLVSGPEAGFRPAVLAWQSDGDERRVYVFGESRGYVFDARRKMWVARAGVPGELGARLRGATVLTAGPSHLLFVISGAASGWSYHTITDTWTAAPDLRGGLGAVRLADGSFAVLGETGEMWVGKRPAVRSRFGWLDYAALIAYPAVLLGMGLLLRVKSSDADGFFRGGQQIPWWAAGLSLVATQVSAIGFMAIPAKSFATDWVYFAGVSMWFVVVPVVTRFYIPAFRRLNVTTAYEYLEARFNFPMRAFASLMFMVMQVSRAAIVLYLPALALSAVTGVDKIWCVLAMGIISTVYTLWGGMEAVIWTDVVQAVTLLGGVVLCLVIVLMNVGGLGTFWTTATGDHKFSMVSEGWSVAGPALWVVLIGNVFSRLAALTADQNVVQRYQATSSNREASRALWTDAAVSIPWAILIFMLGTALYVFYKQNPGLLQPGMETDQIVPLFIAQRVPTGLAGLIIAAIFAASLDGSMLAVSTVFVNDVYARMKPGATARSKVMLARGMTLALGTLATGGAVVLATSNVLSLLDKATQWTGYFAGGFAGLFMLGLFTKRVGAGAAFVGLMASAAVMYFVDGSKSVNVLIYGGVGVVSCVVAGLAASFLLPRREKVQGVEESQNLALARPIAGQ